MLHAKREDIESTAYSMARDTGRKVRDILDDATHNARDVLAVTEKQIREHPLTAGALAAGAGFLLGSIFRRH